MFNKILLAAAVAIGGMMYADSSEAKADNCYRGNFYRPSVNVYSPYRSAYRYAAPRPVYTSPFTPGFGYGGYRYGVPYRGFGPGFGYGSPLYYGRGTTIGVGRGGLSIGIGF